MILLTPGTKGGPKQEKWWGGWNDFVEELCVRFGEKNMFDVVEEFKMLKQTGLVVEYLDKFEELRALLWNAQPHLTEQYFVSNFVSGLKGEL